MTGLCVPVGVIVVAAVFADPAAPKQPDRGPTWPQPLFWKCQYLRSCALLDEMKRVDR